MSLSNYKPESLEINLKGGSFKIEGLSLEGVAVLVREHLPDLEALFNVFQEANKLGDNDMQAIVQSVVSQAPGFAANLIALASGEPESAPQAAKLPFPVQVDVILKIGDLTFSEVGGIKNSLGLIVALLQKNKATLTKVMAKAE